MPGSNPGRVTVSPIHPSLISQYECGYLRLHGALLIRLAQVLQTTPDEILGAHASAAAEEFPVIDRRFLRRLKHVDKLSRHQQRLLLGTIDAFLSKVSRRADRAPLTDARPRLW